MVFHHMPLSCINQSASEFHIPSKLIIAVLNTEQGKIGLISKNKNGSVDLGPMQINSRWWPELYRYHITPQDVLYKPCVNIRVGAWILAKSIAEGNDLLGGVGNYNSHTPIYNQAYAPKNQRKIHRPAICHGDRKCGMKLAILAF